MSPLVEQSPIPTRHAIRTLVEGLVGRDVDLQDTDPPSGGKITNLVGVYVTDALKVSALAVLDLEGAARIGGALGMLPRAIVDEAIDALTLPGLLRDNAYEVLNVLAAVFNLENHPHVRLYQLYGPGGSIPADVLALSQLAGSRMDVVLTVAGYGEARLSIVVR